MSGSRWLKRRNPYPKRRIRNSCKGYRVKSRWYRSPSWAALSRTTKADWDRADKLYVQWLCQIRGFSEESLTVEAVVSRQRILLDRAFKRWADEYYTEAYYNPLKTLK